MNKRSVNRRACNGHREFSWICTRVVRVRHNLVVDRIRARVDSGGDVLRPVLAVVRETVDDCAVAGFAAGDQLLCFAVVGEATYRSRFRRICCFRARNLNIAGERGLYAVEEAAFSILIDCIYDKAVRSDTQRTGFDSKVGVARELLITWPTAVQILLGIVPFNKCVAGILELSAAFQLGAERELRAMLNTGAVGALAQRNVFDWCFNHLDPTADTAGGHIDKAAAVIIGKRQTERDNIRQRPVGGNKTILERTACDFDIGNAVDGQYGLENMTGAVQRKAAFLVDTNRVIADIVLQQLQRAAVV